MAVGTLCLPSLLFAATESNKLRGDRVGWARLKTSHPEWKRHSESDPDLMRFFQDQTTLNIDPIWYAADAESLEEMSKYPVLFAQSIETVKDSKGRNNLAEYMRRGGFLLIDACCNRVVNPDFDIFFQQHVSALATVIPEARISLLPASHAVYRLIFQIPGGHPPHTYYRNVLDIHKGQFGLYGLMIGSRMVGLISLSGLQCGWNHVAAPPGHDIACMRMLVNIYVYAMTQGN